jgi:hypothetical protein
LLLHNVTRRTGSPVIEPEQIADSAREATDDPITTADAPMAQFCSLSVSPQVVTARRATEEHP